MGKGRIGTAMHMVRKSSKKKRLWRETKQEKRWHGRSGEVRVGRLEDLPTDHPARQA